MSYSTVANVVSLFRNLDLTVTDPAVSSDEIADALNDAYNIINAKIGTLYQLPLTSTDNPESWSILKRLEMWLVAAEIDDILNTYAEGDKKPEWAKKAAKMIDELVPPIDAKTGKQAEPTLKLPDATYLGTKTQRNKVSISNTSGTIFEKGGLNW